MANQTFNIPEINFEELFQKFWREQMEEQQRQDIIDKLNDVTYIVSLDEDKQKYHLSKMWEEDEVVYEVQCNKNIKIHWGSAQARRVIIMADELCPSCKYLIESDIARFRWTFQKHDILEDHVVMNRIDLNDS
jgi:hypothetical protein